MSVQPGCLSLLFKLTFIKQVRFKRPISRSLFHSLEQLLKTFSIEHHGCILLPDIVCFNT